MDFAGGQANLWTSALYIGLTLVSVLTWRRYLSPIRDIPGPFVASFTRLWHIGRIFAGDQNLNLIKLHDKHGHYVRIAPDEVSVSHPDAVKKLLLAPVPKGYWYAGLALPDWRYIAPMSVTNPKAKVELSKALSTGYALSNILKFEDAINRPIELLLGWMDQYSHRHEPMHLDKFLTYTAFDVVGEVVFSKPFGFTQQGIDIDNSIANSKGLSFFSATASFYRHWRNLLLTNPLMTQLQILPMGHVFNTAMKAVDERQKNAEARFDIVAHWFRTLEQSPDRLSIRNIHAQATNNIGAGADTVSCSIQAFIYFLMRRPESLRRVREEIRTAQGADAQKLPYLQACIKEALRFFSPVTMGLPRAVPDEGLTIGDRTFSKGTILSVSPWVVHLSEELWGPDAREFNPDRWLKDDAAALEKKYYIPFGAGYNSCPGHHVAKMELLKMGATFVRDYNIRQVDENREWKWEAYFTTVPYDWPVFVEKREKGS